MRPPQSRRACPRFTSSGRTRFLPKRKASSKTAPKRSAEKSRAARAPQRHDEPPSAASTTVQRAVARSAPQAASDPISPARLHIDAESGKPERGMLHASIAAPLSPEIASRAVPPNEPDQLVAQTTVLPVMERRLAPPAVEPRDTAITAPVPDPSPRRTASQPAATAEPEPAGPVRLARPPPVVPVIAITQQTSDSAAVPTVAPARMPPAFGDVAPATALHAGDRAQSRGREAPAPAPTVHVTIGRVEVRAVQAPARDPRPVRAGEQPMSLDEYLRRRGQRGQA